MLVKNPVPLGGNGVVISHRAYVPLCFADSSIFSRQLISKGSEAGGTADKIAENLLRIRGDITAPRVPSFASVCCIPSSGLLSDLGKLLTLQGLCVLPVLVSRTRGGAGWGHVPATKEMTFPSADSHALSHPSSGRFKGLQQSIELTETLNSHWTCYFNFNPYLGSVFFQVGISLCLDISCESIPV